MEQPGGSEGNERSNPIDGNVSKGAGGGWGGLPQPFKDDDIIGRESYPLPVAFKDKHVYQVGVVTFRADFDSANLASVKVSPDSKEYELYTLHDCHGTVHETNHKSWFYFSVVGHKAGDYFIFNVMNMNKQAKLYQNDFRPLFRTFSSMHDWERIRFPCSYQNGDGNFHLRFRHKFDTTEETFFVYCHPNSYEECQAMLRRADSLFATNDEFPMPDGMESQCAESSDKTDVAVCAESSGTSTTSGHCQKQYRMKREQEAAAFAAAKSQIYYKRQLLGLSLDGRRLDLLTITDWSNHGNAEDEQGMPPGLFPAASQGPSKAFKGKKVVFISSRVHPGETPASHLFNGLLAFLLRPTDPRAVALRRLFVFKLVPMLNPDGVARGHYRCDTLGQNLNRFYQNPTQESHPTIFCVQRLLKRYHDLGSLYFYMDLHAHANKRGVFAYGNALEGKEHIATLTYAKLASLNNAHFEFEACNFTEKNMQLKDKNGDSKEGSGRVALYSMTKLVHIYTVEANYCCSRIMNQTSPAQNAPDGRISPPNRLRASPKFTPSLLQGTGRALMVALLDLHDANPWSRLPLSPYANLAGVEDWVKACLSVRQDPGCTLESEFRSSRDNSRPRARDPPALPRGASFKKAGDTIGSCKSKQIFAEVEKRRRNANLVAKAGGAALPPRRTVCYGFGGSSATGREPPSRDEFDRFYGDRKASTRSAATEYKPGNLHNSEAGMSSPDSGATGTDQADDEALQQLRDLGAQQEGSAASEPTRARAGRRASPGSSSSSNALPANDCEASADHGHFDHTSRPTPAPAVSNSPFPAAPTPPGAMSGMPPYVLAGHRAHSEGPSAWRGRPAADIASMNSGIVIGSAMQVKGFGRRRPFNIPSAEGDLVPGGTGGDAMPVHREESCRDLVAPMVVTPILHRRASGRAGRPGPSVVPQMAAFVPVEAE